MSTLPERGDHPFVACLLSLRRDRTIGSSKWGGGGDLDGHVAVKASVLFPAAKKGLQLSLKVDLASFEFPLSGSNFSCYREAPREVAVTPFFMEGGKQRIMDWAQAKKEGCGDFCLRLVVVPISTAEVLVQVGAVPFTLDHLKLVDDDDIAEIEIVRFQIFGDNFILFKICVVKIALSIGVV